MIVKEITDTSYGDLSGQIYKGDITLYNQGIESLYGSPTVINGDYMIVQNKIKNLEGGPTTANGVYIVSDNKLESLKGAPKFVKREFVCTSNPTLKDPRKEIIENGIIAFKYITDKGNFTFAEIEKDIKAFRAKNDAVTRKGFRTLLGLDK